MIALFIVSGLILVQLVALLWLYTSINRYQHFWAEQAQQPGEITYRALGDSAAQGIGATSPMRGYVGLVTKRIEQQTGKSVRVVNLSVTGAKLSDYLRDQAPQIASYQPDIVTIEIGANDIRTYDEQTFRHEFRQVLASLPDGAYVSNMPLFNSRPGSTDSGKAASQVIEQEIARDGRTKFVDLQKQTTDHQSIFGFAPDLFHPNNFSYQNWANAFWLRIGEDV